MQDQMTPMMLAKALYERGDCQGARAILEGALTSTPDDAGLIALYRVVLSSVRAQYQRDKERPAVTSDRGKVTDTWAPPDLERKITDKWTTTSVDGTVSSG